MKPTDPRVIACSARLKKMLNRGMALAQMEDQTGISTPALRHIIDLDRDYYWTSTIELAEMIKPQVMPTALVPRYGTQRRVEALMTQGWSAARLAEELGFSRSWFSRAFRGDFIQYKTYATVKDLYERLWDQKPERLSKIDNMSINKTLAHAKRMNYAPPLAWDDDTIDDPDAKPFF